MKKAVVIKVVLLASLGVLIYLVLDYFNIFSWCGLKVSNFNLDLMGMVINASLAIALYSFTFEFVDKRNALKQRNKEQVANLMLADVYQSCLLCMSIIDHIENNEAGTYIDNSYKAITIDKSDEIINTLLRDPFIYEPNIIEFFKDGTLSKDEYSVYTKNKNDFKEYVLLKSREFNKKYQFQDNTIRNKLEDEIKAAINRLKVE